MNSLKMICAHYHAIDIRVHVVVFYCKEKICIPVTNEIGGGGGILELADFRLVC